MQAPNQAPRALIETPFKARALLLGERLDLRAWKAVDALATNPLTVEVKGGGIATLYRYGVVVLFGVHSAEEVAFLAQLHPSVIHPYPQPELEELEARVAGAEREGLSGGVVLLADRSLARLQVLADVLSKSVLLSLYERKVAGEFDRIEPLADQLRSGRIPRHSKELLKMIGSMLLVEQRMVGRAEIADKPEILWENPSMEALFVKVEDEFEISARHAALERKLNLIGQTAQTVMQLLSNKHSLRVEWYIVILIFVEIVLTLYELFLH
jgi:required for meiotic nuclear division protein 1